MTDPAPAKNAKKKLSTAKGKFTRIHNRLLAGYNENEETSVILQIMNELEDAYKEIDLRYEDYITLLDSDDESDQKTITDYSNKMEFTYDQLCKCRVLIHKKPKDSGKVDDGKENLLYSAPVVQQVRVKKLDAPTFNGDIRSYPSFKRDYERHMTPMYGKDPYALKKCITGDALITIKGVDDDFDEMIRRLDNKYGRPEKLSDAIVSQLKKLKKIQEGDTKKFIELVETVETSWLDMKRLNLEKEMNSITIVSQIEKLIPPVQLREWVIRKHQLSSDMDQFEHFLQFLITEKEAMEYMQGDLRSEKKEMAGKTNSIDVTETDLTGNSRSINAEILDKMFKNEEMIQKVITGLEHVAEAVKLGKSGNAFIRDRKCWYHDTDNHEIGECTAFARLPYNERMEKVRERRSCFCCLKRGHISRRCPDKSSCSLRKDNNEECRMFHHKFLHEDNIERINSHTLKEGQHKTPGNDMSLLMISEVACFGQKLITLWDSGSNISLITRKAAKELDLKGKKVMLRITKAGNQTEMEESIEYTVPLCDRKNKLW